MLACILYRKSCLASAFAWSTFPSAFISASISIMALQLRDATLNPIIPTIRPLPTQNVACLLVNATISLASRLRYSEHKPLHMHILLSLVKSSYTVICEHPMRIVCRRGRKTLGIKGSSRTKIKACFLNNFSFSGFPLLYNPNNLYNDIEYRYCVFY
jgi:hypothetical protein